MSANHKQLPQGYAIRIPRHSDILRIICFYVNEIPQGQTIKQIIVSFFLFTAISFILLFLYTNSYLIANISILFSIVLSFISYIPLYLYWNKAITNKDCLVIYHKNQLCAIVVATSSNNYSYIKEIFVASLYRRKGLATYLMQKALENLSYPIYLLSIPKKHLIEFYNSLGFVLIDNNKLPTKIQRDLNLFNKRIKLQPMIMKNYNKIVDDQNYNR